MTNYRTIPVYSALADVVCVLVFVAIGRSSHNEAGSVLGFFGTAWPFVVGLALGWVLFRAWRRPVRVVWTGVGVWGMTVAGGIALRALTAQGTEISFVVVTAVVLAVFLLGWRLVVRWTARVRRKP
jgi:hypothetical protein